MRVALIRQRFGGTGGAEGSVKNLATELARIGHDVHIFAHRWGESDQEAGLTFHRVPVVRGASILKILAFTLYSALLVRKERFDIVHSFERTLHHDIYRAGDGCHKEWLFRRHRAFPWRRPLDVINPLHRSILALERRIFTPGCSRMVIANSKKTKEAIIRHYAFPEKQIVVVYNGVDLDRFHPRNRERSREPARNALGLGRDDLVFLFVGSGFERKGLRYLIRGAAWTLSRHPMTPLKVVVAGKGNPRPYLALARRLGLQGRLRFVGVWSKIEELYAAADAFVLPTLYDPFANVTLEAMAVGLPVITTEADGASELLVDGWNGFVLKDPPDPRDLGEKILILFEEKRGASMGREARHTADQFSMTRYVQETLTIYSELLEAKGTA